MTKSEMTTLLRSVGSNENTITAMENAFDMGVDYEREACAKVCDNLALDDAFTSDILQVTAAVIRARGEA